MKFVSSKIFEIIYMFAIVTVLVVIGIFLMLVLDGGCVEDYDFNKAVLIIIFALVCNLQSALAVVVSFRPTTYECIRTENI